MANSDELKIVEQITKKAKTEPVEEDVIIIGEVTSKYHGSSLPHSVTAEVDPQTPVLPIPPPTPHYADLSEIIPILETVSYHVGFRLRD